MQIYAKPQNIDPSADAEQAILPTTPIVFPDGTVGHGLEELGTIVADFIGSNNFTLGPISKTFQYRPLDLNTVAVYGIVNFTIEDHAHRTTRILSNVQTELFRRNYRMPRRLVPLLGAFLRAAIPRVVICLLPFGSYAV
jgi:hypothetical protein